MEVGLSLGGLRGGYVEGAVSLPAGRAYGAYKPLLAIA